MDQTPNLLLPYIAPAQAQKHVTHNEAIRALDAILQIGVLDRDLSAPPASPADGDRYLIGAGPSGLWAGHANHVAAWQDGAWMFYEPREGWLAWIADEGQLCVWNGAEWVLASSGSGEGGGDGDGAGVPEGGAEGQLLRKNSDDDGDAVWASEAPLLGINATADTTNRLAVAAPASLFNHEGGGHQIKLNKNAAGDTASFLFQTGFSGRAEIGTAGDDDFHFKVSADGSAWFDAIVIDRESGEVSFPNTDIGDGGGGGGGVSSVSLTAPTGFSVAGSPVTGAGTLALSYSAGYQAYTGAEASKLAGIQAGAQVNPDISGLALKSTAIAAGTGLTGGGDLSANRTLTLSSGVQASLVLADSAVQPGDLANVATSGDYNDLINVPSGGAGGGRELLTANRTYYVRKDGSDSNAGLVNNSGGAFLTIQKAIDVVASLDISIHTVVIEVADGTYAAAVVLKQPVGAGAVILQGNTTSPTNVVISPSSGYAITAAGSSINWTVQGFRCVGGTGGANILVSKAASVVLGVMSWGAAGIGFSWIVSDSGRLSTNASQTIAGNQSAFIYCDGGRISWTTSTTTLTGTPAFSFAFVACRNLGSCYISGVSFSGGATGLRYSASINATIATDGSGANYLPGNTAGTTATGGQYA